MRGCHPASEITLKYPFRTQLLQIPLRYSPGLSKSSGPMRVRMSGNEVIINGTYQQVRDGQSRPVRQYEALINPGQGALFSYHAT